MLAAGVSDNNREAFNMAQALTRRQAEFVHELFDVLDWPNFDRILANGTLTRCIENELRTDPDAVHVLKTLAAMLNRVVSASEHT
jgi:hypothetical protein